MKRLLLSLLIGLSLFSCPSFSHTLINIHLVENKEEIVYVTKTGNKYHTASCRYLRQSKRKITKTVAISNGYSACKVCKP